MKEIEILLSKVYRPDDISIILNGIENLLEKYNYIKKSIVETKLTEKDVVLITYGDQVYKKGKAKLQSLNQLLLEQLKEEISIVHILPFFPYSSDDGFSVIDYYKVNTELGDWKDIESISHNFNLLFDAVINHSSQYCEWFIKFLNNEEDYKEFYIEMDDSSAYKDVVRPRISPLSHSYKGKSGSKEVWTTFSRDQVDLNFKNPKVLLQILDLLLFYILEGARIIRLDAVGFLWKEKYTTCIHLPQTHLLIKVIRKVIEKISSSVLILSETNVPHLENISYFSNGDEAHMVYNFTLPPLLAFSILSGSTKKLTEWAKSLVLPFSNVCYFNFLASHDGIGLRPVDNILTEEELSLLVDSAKANGGLISCKSNPDGKQSPYEINCNYFSLLKGLKKEENLGIRRSILAHAVLLAMPGLPAIYFHSMFGSENDLEGVKKSGINRRINREKFEYGYLNKILENSSSRQVQILDYLKKLILIRKREPAFNPYSAFAVNRPDRGIFHIQRTSQDGDCVVDAYFNLGQDTTQIKLNYLEEKADLISGKIYKNILYLNSLDFVWLKIK